MWRAEDIFFAAMGGGNYGGPGIEKPEEIAEQRQRRRRASRLALAPLMHGNAQWSMFVGAVRRQHRDARTRAAGSTPTRSGTSSSARASASSRSSATRWRARSSTRSRTAPRPPSLFAIVSGGAILSPRSSRSSTSTRPNVVIVDAFGASETGANGAVDVTDKGPRFRMNEWTTVITDDGDVAPVGEVGLLARRGHVPVGYYKDEAKTAATFVEMHGVRWAIPGDRAVIEDDGTITVLGRGSQCINTGGEKVFPEEVEAVLKSHPDVFDAIVVGVPDERWGETVARGRRAARRPRGDARAARRALPHRARGLQGAAPARRRRNGRAHARRQAELPLGQGNRDGYERDGLNPSPTSPNRTHRGSAGTAR